MPNPQNGQTHSNNSPGVGAYRVKESVSYYLKIQIKFIETQLHIDTKHITTTYPPCMMYYF